MRLNELSVSSQTLTALIETVFSKRASFRFRVNGFSMSPFIQDNDIITISPAWDSRIELGRPVGFIHPMTKKLIIHRVVGRKNGGYVIKGDNIFQIDGLIPKKDILGCVTKIERGGKSVRIGLGLLCLAIAFLSRIKLLPLLVRGFVLVPISVRRFIKCRVLPLQP